MALTVPASSPRPRGAEDWVMSARARLKNDDLRGALADAEKAVAAGGGAKAYAARADAKRALGFPPDEAIADYAVAARVDAFYAERYEGLVAQHARPAGLPRHDPDLGVADVPLAVVKALGAAGLFLIAGAWLILRSSKTQPPAF
jgi:hypothetical protein